MMKCARIFHRGINPGFDNFNDKETILGNHLCISHAAFKIRVVMKSEKGRDLFYLHNAFAFRRLASSETINKTVSFFPLFILAPKTSSWLAHER
jgi:hypothetical protein